MLGRMLKTHRSRMVALVLFGALLAAGVLLLILQP